MKFSSGNNSVSINKYIFKNVSDAKGFAQDYATHRAKQLSEKYFSFECQVKRCNHTESVVEMEMTDNGFVFTYPFTCCRDFERKLKVVLKSETHLT